VNTRCGSRAGFNVPDNQIAIATMTKTTRIVAMIIMMNHAFRQLPCCENHLNMILGLPAESVAFINT